MTAAAIEPPRGAHHDFRSVAAIFLCALIAVVPLFVRGNSFGHDFDFHLLSWMETATQWHGGVIHPHWVATANYGAGEPRFLFYPPASWMLGALLGMMTSWAAAPMLFIFAALFFSGTSLYTLAGEWVSRDAAMMAACLYAVNPYAMFCAYERSAYGELLAGAWVPLILLFALRRRSSLVPLALSVAAIWLTNAPAAVMACYTLAGLAVVATLAEKKVWPLARAASGCLLGLGVASFYLVPAAYERQWVEIARAIAPGLRPEESFLFAGTGDAFHMEVLKTASIIALILLVSAAVSAVVLWTSKHRCVDCLKDPRVLGACTILTLIVIFLLLPISRTVWKFAPEMRFLQFPWRWLLVQSVATSLVIGATACCLLQRWLRGRLLMLAVLVCAGLVVGGETYALHQSEDEDDTLASQLTTYQSGFGVEGTDEYTPIQADNTAIQKNLPQVRVLEASDGDEADSAQTNPVYQPGRHNIPAQVNVDRWQTEHKVIRITTATAGFAILRLMDYPGWHVLLNSSAQTARPQRHDGLMVIPIRGGTSRIEVTWQPTRDALWGRTATYISLFLLLPIARLERRKSENTQV